VEAKIYQVIKLQEIKTNEHFIYTFIYGKKYTYKNYKKTTEHDSLIYDILLQWENCGNKKSSFTTYREQLLNNCEQYACYNYGHGFLVFLLFSYICRGLYIIPH